MNEITEAFLFWTVCGLASAWILRQFYFSKNAKIAARLRMTAVIIEAAVLGLFFFPFVPKGLGGFTGWEIVGQGNAGIIIFLALAIVSAAFFLTKKRTLLKVGVAAHIFDTIFFFAVMITMFPETIILTFRDIAPIILALLMLINTLVVLLLLNKLIKQKGHST